MAKHEGGCHCGQVRYEFDADIQGVIACNCSMCGKAGTLLAFMPESAFQLKSGEGVLRDYQFNRHIIHHLFCGNCGIKSFARGVAPDGSPTIAVNARCIDGFAEGQYPVHQYDGAHH